MSNTSEGMTLKDIFNVPRQEGQPNLVDEISNMLRSVGLVQEADSCFLADIDIIIASTKTNSVQRHIINRFFTLQLLAFEQGHDAVNGRVCTTIEQRYHLIADGTDEEWLDLFKRGVLPFLIENRLPQKIIYS